MEESLLKYRWTDALPILGLEYLWRFQKGLKREPVGLEEAVVRFTSLVAYQSFITPMFISYLERLL